MTKLTTLYNLIKQWRKKLEQLQQQKPYLINPQAIEVTEKMLESARTEYISRGGRRPV